MAFLHLSCLSSDRPTGRFLCEVRIKMDPRLPRSKRKWTLLSGLRYVDSAGRLHRVLHDFETDGASIPRFWWRAIGHPMDEQYLAAGVIHDFLWRQAMAGEITFGYANWVFVDALRSLGVWRWRRWAMWLAVSINAGRLGVFHWFRCRRGRT